MYTNISELFLLLFVELLVLRFVVSTDKHTYAQEHFSFHVHVPLLAELGRIRFFWLQFVLATQPLLRLLRRVFLCFGRYRCSSCCLYLEGFTVAMSLGNDTFFYKNPQIQLIRSVQSSLSSPPSSSLHTHLYSFFLPLFCFIYGAHFTLLQFLLNVEHAGKAFILLRHIGERAGAHTRICAHSCVYSTRQYTI